MPKKTITLDTPFKRGESVMLVRPIPGHVEGQRGKVRLVNGFDEWKRYWVRFADGDLVGSVDHDALVRPRMYEKWRERQAADAASAENAQSASTTAAEIAPTSGGGGGIADQIPAQLLERSQAAKARLTGG
ncbi:MAG: hypothetical protein KJN63_06405 [Acidimicrobiia bacterium]|nr:hypothetical protein [Acidimicrobiia bacterium]